VTGFVLPGSELVYKHPLFAYKNRYKYYYLISKFKFVLDKSTVHCMSLATRIPRRVRVRTTIVLEYTAVHRRVDLQHVVRIVVRRGPATEDK
jgi:hypothetical protein